MNNVAFLGSGSSYVTNPNPMFIPPKHHKSRPPVIKHAYNLANKRRVYMWEGFAFYKNDVKRKRRFNIHRGKAIQAGVLCMIHHFNAISGIVEASCEQMSDMCGLSTYSKAGNKSISRFTRMIASLEEYGLLECENIWDRVLGMYIPKIIMPTKLFFRMIGLSLEEFEKGRNQLIGFRKRGLTLDEQEQLTPTEAKRRAKLQFIEKAFNARKKRHSEAKRRRKAKEFVTKSLDEQRSDIANSLISTLTPKEIESLGLDGFKDAVNLKLGQLRNLAKGSPP